MTRPHRNPCPLCGLTSEHHHRNPANRIVWCKATDHTWPTAALIARVGGRRQLCDQLGIDIRTMPSEISDVQADRWAIRCGFHPNQVWPGWSDAGLRYVDRVFLESGWRQAFMHWERTVGTEAAA